MHLGIASHHGRRKFIRAHSNRRQIDWRPIKPCPHTICQLMLISCRQFITVKKEHIPSLHALMVCKLCNAAKKNMRVKRRQSDRMWAEFTFQIDWMFAQFEAAFLLLLFVSSVQPPFGLEPEGCVDVKSNAIMASKFTVWLARSASSCAKSLLIALNVWKWKEQPSIFQPAVQTMFATMSAVHSDMNYTDLLSEMS